MHRIAGRIGLVLVLGALAGCRGCSETETTAISDAGAVTATSSSAKTRAPYLPSGSASSDGPLSIVDWVLSRMQPSFNRCYKTAVKDDPKLSGEAVFHLAIGKSGEVTDVSLVSQKGLGMDLVACIASAFKTASFPAPEHGPVEVNVPLVFAPKAVSPDASRGSK